MIRALAIVLMLTADAAAHSFYDAACCGEKDCRPVPCDQLAEEANGYWRYIPTGNLFEPARVFPSQDKHCHVCLHNGGSQCLFIQNGV